MINIDKTQNDPGDQLPEGKSVEPIPESSDPQKDESEISMEEIEKSELETPHPRLPQFRLRENNKRRFS